MSSTTLLHGEYSPISEVVAGTDFFVQVFRSSSPIGFPSFLDFRSSVPLSRSRWLCFVFCSVRGRVKAIRAPWVVLVILLWVSSKAGGLFVFTL